MRAHDWAATPLGAVSGWASTHKLAMGLLLTSRFEMWLGWGDDVALFYNDAHRPTLGSKHPQALGTPLRQVYPEIWDDIKERIQTAQVRAALAVNRELVLLYWGDRQGDSRAAKREGMGNQADRTANQGPSFRVPSNEGLFQNKLVIYASVLRGLAG